MGLAVGRVNKKSRCVKKSRCQEEKSFPLTKESFPIQRSQGRKRAKLFSRPPQDSLAHHPRFAFPSPNIRLPIKRCDCDQEPLAGFLEKVVLVVEKGEEEKVVLRGGGGGFVIGPPPLIPPYFTSVLSLLFFL